MDNQIIGWMDGDNRRKKNRMRRGIVKKNRAIRRNGVREEKNERVIDLLSHDGISS